MTRHEEEQQHGCYVSLSPEEAKRELLTNN
jgi:hypothetical protein